MVARSIERFGGWSLVIIFCAMPLARWLMLQNLGELFSSSFSVFSALAKLFGIAGLILYAINLCLAARLKWLEPLFGGLNRLYIAHHLTGAISLSLLLFHPLFLAIRFIEVGVWDSLIIAAKYLLPRAEGLSVFWDITSYSVSINNGFVAYLGMVILLMLTFYVKLPYGLWLFSHKFLGVAFLFSAFHVLFTPSDISRDPFLKYYSIVFIAFGLSAYLYRLGRGTFFTRNARYTVSLVAPVPGNSLAIELVPVKKAINYKAGQFLFIRFLRAGQDGISSESHPFSIASAPNEPELRLYVKKLGDYTKNLSGLRVGTIAEVEGAYGRFQYRRFGQSPQIWIGGGIGITPFLSMARNYGSHDPPVNLIYSVVKRSELLEQQTLEQVLPMRYPQFAYHIYSSEDQEGYLNADKVEVMAGGLQGKHIFICGPPSMMKSLRKQFVAKGVPNRNIHSEEFSMS